MLQTFYRHAGDSCLEISVRSAAFPQAQGLAETVWAKEIAERHEDWGRDLPKDPGDLWPFLMTLDDASCSALFAHCAALSANAVLKPWNKRPRALAHADQLAGASGRIAPLAPTHPGPAAAPGLSRFSMGTRMSANTIYDHAPLGSLIRYSDGTPKPPSRFSKKVAAWERRNGTGRLVKNDPPRERESWSAPATITLHESNFETNGIILVTVMRTHSVTSDLIFKVIERPAIGMVYVLQHLGENVELLHLVESREAAELWLAKNPHARIYRDPDPPGHRADDRPFRLCPEAPAPRRLPWRNGISAGRSRLQDLQRPGHAQAGGMHLACRGHRLCRTTGIIGGYPHRRR